MEWLITGVLGLWCAASCYHGYYTITTPGDSEQIWARVSLKGSKHMYIGSFYRPSNVIQQPFTDLNDMLDSIIRQSRDKLIALGGDFNCKDINWVHRTIPGGSIIKPVCKALVSLAEDNGLSQLQLNQLVRTASWTYTSQTMQVEWKAHTPSRTYLTMTW